jgi:hypothetical protein
VSHPHHTTATRPSLSQVVVEVEERHRRRLSVSLPSDSHAAAASTLPTTRRWAPPEVEFSLEEMQTMLYGSVLHTTSSRTGEPQSRASHHGTTHPPPRTWTEACPRLLDAQYVGAFGQREQVRILPRPLIRTVKTQGKGAR